jgi:hypothetical protein
MRILSLLNVSNVHDLSRDSGFIMQRIMGEELASRGVELCLVGPAVPAFSQMRIDWARVHAVPLGSSKYQVRYHFDWPTLERLVLELEPDVILNNQVELAPALRGILATHDLRNTALLSYCHYIPFSSSDGDDPMVLDPSLNQQGMGPALALALAAAANASDRVIVQSQFARQLLIGLSRRLLGFGFEDRLTVIAPPVDPLLLRPLRTAAPACRRAFYNHRLYDHYGTGEIVALARDLAAATDFELLVADAMPNRSNARARLDTSVARNRAALAALECVRFSYEGGVRASYRQMIESCRIGLAPFRPGCVWSMAALDCMGMGVPVLAPGYAAYPEFIPDYLCFSSRSEAQRLARRLLDDDAFWLRASRDCSRLAARHSSVRAVDDLLALVDERRGASSSSDLALDACAAHAG